MFNRPLRTNGIGNSFVDSLSWGRSVVPQYPPYGTYISSACGTYNGLGQYDTVNDALGTQWNVSVEVWNQLADGVGGSFWTDSYTANVSPCFYPYGYVHTGYVNNTLHWSAQNGDNGDFYWGEQWDVNYYDGAGGSVHEDGLYNAYDYGYVISSNDAAGVVVNLQNGNWAFWYGYGYYLGQASYPINYTTECWAVAIGGYTNNVYADGYGGTYEIFYAGGWSGESDIGDCNGYRYHHNGSGEVSSYWIDTGGGGGGESYPSYGTYLDGSSNPITTDIYFNGYVDGNYQSGSTNIEIGYSYNNTYADGNGGSYSESGNSWAYADYTDIFTAPYGNELKLDWSFEDPSGAYNGQFKWADELGVWKINQGSTYMDRMYVAPLVSDGYVIFEGNAYAGEYGQYKTQIILQNGIWISNTINF